MANRLAEWLHAQLDEDERIAREAAMAVGRTGYEGGVLTKPPARFGDDLVADGAQWESSYHKVMRKRLGPGEKGRTVADCGGFGARPVAVHAANHDPARVLREIDAKRRVVRAYEDAVTAFGVTEVGTDLHNLMGGSVNSLRAALQMLALPYADRPGYKEEWRP